VNLSGSNLGFRPSRKPVLSPKTVSRRLYYRL
jgi:hypothetical protein